MQCALVAYSQLGNGNGSPSAVGHTRSVTEGRDEKTKPTTAPAMPSLGAANNSGGNLQYKDGLVLHRKNIFLLRLATQPRRRGRRQVEKIISDGCEAVVHEVTTAAGNRRTDEATPDWAPGTGSPVQWLRLCMCHP